MVVTAQRAPVNVAGFAHGSSVRRTIHCKKQESGKVAKLTPFPVSEAEIRMTKARAVLAERVMCVVFLPEASEMAVA